MKRRGSLRPSPSMGSLARSLGRPPGTALPRLSLFRRIGRPHLDVDELAAQLAVAKRDAAVAQREQGMVPADADAVAGIIFGAALAHDDVAGEDILAAELLHAEPLALGVAAVAGRTACFLVCHDETLASISLRGFTSGRLLCRSLLLRRRRRVGLIARRRLGLGRLPRSEERRVGKG